MTSRLGIAFCALLATALLLPACGRQQLPTRPAGAQADRAVEPLWSGSGSSTLQVRKAGTGSGTVTSSPSGIHCGSTCSRSFANGTRITLTASPASGSTFAGWNGGGCSGTGPCTIQLNGGTTVTATFNTTPSPPPPPDTTATFTLTVVRVQNGSGSGSVSSSPAGISCGSTCTATFPAGTSITLSASVSTGRFVGWSGGPCSGSTSPSCTFTLNANTTITATYDTQPLSFIETTLPDGNVGADYSAFINTTGGQGGPDQFRIVAGSLPDGLQMAQSFGVQSTLISGRPTRQQTSTFTVEARDESGTAQRTFTITIGPSVTLAITLPGPTAKSGTLGTFYFQNLFASGGTTPYSWSITSGALPPGLRVVAASNGNRIEGTPTARGTYTFGLTVRDKGGQQATQQTSITIQ